MDERETLEEARRLLGDDLHWTKDSLIKMVPGGDPALCLQGACMRAVGWDEEEEMQDPEHMDRIIEKAMPLAGRLAAVIAEQFPDRVIQEHCYDPWDVVTAFNDHDHTVLPDVHLVIDKALAGETAG